MSGEGHVKGFIWNDFLQEVSGFFVEQKEPQYDDAWCFASKG